MAHHSGVFVALCVMCLIVSGCLCCVLKIACVELLLLGGGGGGWGCKQ